MSDGMRKIVRIVGMVIIAAALGAIGYSAYNLITAGVTGPQESLDEINEMLENPEDFVNNVDLNAQVDGTNPLPGDDPFFDDPVFEDPAATDIPFYNEDMGTVPPAGGIVTPKPNGSGSGSGKGSGKTTKPAYTGKLVFESLGKQIAVLEGVTDGNLNRGAAHHSRSSPPGGVGNCVIYGHRNTVFRGFDRLKKGDTIRLEVPGKQFTYKITSMSVVEPDDPAIFMAHGAAVMTLVTCYPFHFVGPAPQRYIVVCTLQ